MNERDEMRALAEAHGCGVEYIPVREKDGIYKRVYKPVRPVPCLRDERGEIKEQTVKALLAKVDEELNELKEEIYSHLGHYGYSGDNYAKEFAEEAEIPPVPPMVAEEAADTITAITTLCEALGIDAEERDEAQQRVNRKNLERGRL